MKKLLLLGMLVSVMCQVSASNEEIRQYDFFYLGYEASEEAVAMVDNENQPDELEDLVFRGALPEGFSWTELSPAERAGYVECLLDRRQRRIVRQYFHFCNDQEMDRILSDVRANSGAASFEERVRQRLLQPYALQRHSYSEVAGIESIQLGEDIMKPGFTSLLISAYVLFWQDKGINLFSRWYNSWKKPKNELPALRRKRKREQIKKIAALMTIFATNGVVVMIMKRNHGNSLKRQTARILSALGASVAITLPAFLRSDKKLQLIEQQIKSLQTTSKG